MAHKLTCPECLKVLKEEGDKSKEAQGEYRVYDNLANSAKKANMNRLILCLSCRHAGTVESFDI